MNLRSFGSNTGALMLVLALASACSTLSGHSRRTHAIGPSTPTAAAASARGEKDDGWLPLFPTSGIPDGWIVRNWNDVTQPAPPEARWEVLDGILTGSRPRGTWLVSETEYSDFLLEFEFRLGDRGQSGVGLRFPIDGDPAVQGLEIQLVDPKYYGPTAAVPSTYLSGAIFQAVPPLTDAYRPATWNRLRVDCRGAEIVVTLNGQEVQRVDLDRRTDPTDRGQPLSARPRRGHLGFQECSRGTGVVEIRSARIRVLD